MNVLKEHPRVLVVSGTQKGREYLSGILPKSDFESITTVSGAGEAKRLLLSQAFDIIIINTPLSDEFGLDFALNIVEDTAASVMVLVKSDVYEQAAYKVEDYGVLTISKPSSLQSMLQSIRLMVATRARLRVMEKKNEEMKRKMEEVRLVSRAKWALIETEGISEGEAHRRIEKLAMDTRMQKRDIAQGIITKYKN